MKISAGIVGILSYSFMDYLQFEKNWLRSFITWTAFVVFSRIQGKINIVQMFHLILDQFIMALSRTTHILFCIS